MAKLPAVPAMEILTGAAERYGRLRQEGDVSGYADTCHDSEEDREQLLAYAVSLLRNLPEGAVQVWGEYPGHEVADWQYEVANGDTRLGYWEWVRHQIEIQESDARVHAHHQADPAAEAASGRD